MAQLPALQIEVVHPHGLVPAVGQIKEGVVGRHGNTVANNEVAIHAVHRKIRVEPEQFGLAADKIGMHTGAPVAPAPVAFTVV